MRHLIKRLRTRWQQITSYAALAAAPRDGINLAVLGFARGHPFDANDLLARLGRRVYRTIQVRPASLRGLRVELDARDISQLVVFEEVIRDDLYDFRLVPFTPDLIVDCGAHIGLFAMKASLAFPGANLTAFEPNPDNVRLLRAHRRLNGLSFEIVPAAVALANGEEWFHAAYGCSGALVDEPPGDGAAFRVPILDLRAWLSRRAPRQLLLKIDIEGAERTLVPGILPVLPTPCALFFETHGGEATWDYLAKLLADAGFQVTRLNNRSPLMDGFALRRAG
jgi:FkbM family methyltransferase